MSPASIVALAGLSAWLTFETVWDLKDRNIPVWFSLATIPPGLIWLGRFVSPWAALLLAISIIATETVHRPTLLGYVALLVPLPLSAVFFPEIIPLVCAWGMLIGLWLLRILGGADALAGLALMLFFPSWVMAACIAAGFLIWGLIVLWFRHRKNIGLRLWAVFSNRLDGERLPAIGALASAALIYFLVLLYGRKS